MLQKKLNKLRSKLRTEEQVKLLDQIESEIKRMEKISEKYATAFSHCWDGMPAEKAAAEVGLTKNGAWV